MTKLFDLQNDVAVVMGGTGVLGGAMATALAAHGARVAVVGRNPQRGQQRVDQITSASGEAAFFAADVLDVASLEQAEAAIQDRLGTPTVVVNAAGGNRPDATLAPGAKFADLPLEGFQGVFDLNLVGGVILPTQVFAPGMLAAGQGSIINIARWPG